MRKLVYLFLICAIGYGIYTFTSNNRGDEIVLDDGAEADFVTMTNGNVKGEFTRIGDFEIELRVFGGADSIPNEGPFALLTHMIFASSRSQANSVFNRFLCEKGAVNQASMIQLIVNDPQSKNDVEEVLANREQRNCAYLAGTSYHMDRIFTDGKEMKGLRFTSSTKSDPYKYIKVKEFRIIPCD